MFQYKNTSYHLECLSKEKIPYNLPQELNEKIWKSPDELFIKEDGTFKVFDIDVDSCPFCGEAFNDNFIDVRKKTDCIMITKYRMAEVQCKQIFFINCKFKTIRIKHNFSPLIFDL